jgi:hypothetical protein
MAELLTNAILASIIHLIRRDLAGNRVHPHMAPLHWAPSRRAPPRRQCRRPREDGARAVTPPPQY